MSSYVVKDTELTSVANAIRTKGGTNASLTFPNGFVSAIGNISGGGSSSNLSTAEVTLNLTPPAGITIIDKFVGAEFGVDENYGYNGALEVIDNKVYPVLYNGEATIYGIHYYDAENQSYTIDKEATITETGGVHAVYTEFDEEISLTITGDGSITATLKEGGGIK